MKNILILLISFLIPLSVFGASNTLTFPMTIYGNMRDTWWSLLPSGTKISFLASGVIIGEYTLSEAWKFGYSNSFSWMSPTFSQFSGALNIRTNHQWIEHVLSSFSSNTQGCSLSGSIIFIEWVCSYDIVVTRITPIPAPSGWWGWGWWWGSFSPPSPISPNTTTQDTPTQTKQTSIAPNSTTSDSSKIAPAVALAKWKSIVVKTELPRGTRLTLYRVLNNWRTIRAGSVRVQNNWNVRVFAKIKWNYIIKKL